MPIVTARELLRAGAHFGHRTSRWDPRMAPYIWDKRNKVHIIDVRQTVRGIVAGYHFLRREASFGGMVLFVGTKRQAREVVQQKALETGSPYVVERWLGGTLTNLDEVRKRVDRLVELEQLEADDALAGYSKKVRARLLREKRKIHRNLEGIREMHDLPAAVVIVDPRHEETAVREANRMAVPVVAMLDTDCNPENIDLPIPANDDSIRSIEIVIGLLAGAVAEGQGLAREGKMDRPRAEVIARQVVPAARTPGLGAVSTGALEREEGPIDAALFSARPDDEPQEPD